MEILNKLSLYFNGDQEDPLAPVDLCDETVACLLSLGTLNELVIHQPQNQKYKEKQEQVQRALEKHLSLCEKCRTTLEKENSQN